MGNVLYSSKEEKRLLQYYTIDRGSPVDHHVLPPPIKTCAPGKLDDDRGLSDFPPGEHSKAALARLAPRPRTQKEYMHAHVLPSLCPCCVFVPHMPNYLSSTPFSVDYAILDRNASF